MENTIFSDKTNYKEFGKIPESLILTKYPTIEEKMRAEIRAGGVS